MTLKPATRDHHPARVERSGPPRRRPGRAPSKRLILPKDQQNVEVEIERQVVKLTNLGKLFWPRLGITKRDLLQYYSDVAPFLLQHLTARAIVMHPHHTRAPR